MASQPDPTQEEDETDQEEDKSERKWKLKDCSMHVGMYGKRAVKDQAMTIDLVFDFEGDPTSKVVGKSNFYNLNTKWSITTIFFSLLRCFIINGKKYKI